MGFGLVVLTLLVVAAAASSSSSSSSSTPGPDPQPQPHDDPTTFDAYIRGAAVLYQIPESVVRAVIYVESRYNPNAVSKAGASGLMQLMPSTAKYLGVSNPFDPRQNIYGGVKYLRTLANRFGDDVVIVAAAYNAGPGNVQKYNGVPPFKETQAYVRSVRRELYQSALYQPGADTSKIGAFDDWAPPPLPAWTGGKVPAIPADTQPDPEQDLCAHIANLAASEGKPLTPQQAADCKAFYAAREADLKSDPAWPCVLSATTLAEAFACMGLQ